MSHLITAHMVVKNEDQWIWYAIKSVLPHVDRLLITDTGSQDKTVDIIKSFSSDKIVFKKSVAHNPRDVTRARQDQIDSTTTPWLWMVDGDEVYPEQTAHEVVSAVRSGKYEGIVVRRYDLLGDIYHRQRESVGEYRLFGHRGHLVTRLVNKGRIKGLHLSGDYPLEGFYDIDNLSTRDRDPKNWYLTSNYLYHAMYLRRSSLGGNLAKMFNRSKYKVDKGIPIIGKPPEAITSYHPAIVPSQLHKRSLTYELLASLITPVKDLKRRISK